MEKEKKNLQQIINYRMEKLEKIRQTGHNPYAYKFDKINNIPTNMVMKDDVKKFPLFSPIYNWKIAGRSIAIPNIDSKIPKTNSTVLKFIN